MNKNIANLPLYFTDIEKEAFINIYNSLSGHQNLLGIIPPTQGYKVAYIVIENNIISNDITLLVDKLSSNNVFLLEFITLDEIDTKEHDFYAFK